MELYVGDKYINVPLVDLEIQFIGASGIPKMDVVGSADPYFIAKIDDKISFISSVKGNTLKPVWNEIWRVKNVPSSADIVVKVMDKDEGKIVDDSIGKFKTSVSPGAKEIAIEGMLSRDRGSFWLKISSSPSKDEHSKEFPYLFDGPVRYSRHSSPTVGRLTNIDDHLYSTWKVYLKGVPLFFRDQYQPWNHNYKAAQSIFQGPTSIAVRSGIRAGHSLLYARTANNGFGIDTQGIIQILQSSSPQPSGCTTKSQSANRVKPAVYTYVITSDDDSFRCSETGSPFFVDFASKHALHSNCSETVRYSGEFHPRPRGGWQNFHDDLSDGDVKWEFVIDNNSGTYAPDKALLPTLTALLEFNFPDVAVVALDRQDPQLEESREACRAYALKYRGVRQDELQPHVKDGEAKLSQQAFLGMKNGITT